MTAAVPAKPLHRQQGYIVVCGGDEQPGNVLMAELYGGQLKALKARVLHKPYPGVSAHAFPPDFSDRFGEWITFVLTPTSPTPD